MTHSDPGRPRGRGNDEALRDTRAAILAGPLPDTAQRTLGEIADALGLTVALLGYRHSTEPPRDTDAAGLAEAAALLQAFVRIRDPGLRRRCVAFVQDAAGEHRQRT